MAQAEEDHAFLITRVFNAPRDLVWKAWTEAEGLARWWGPKGMTIEIAKLEMRPGGIFHYAMRAPSGKTMWGRFIYREIAAPERLVYISSFSDPEGGLTRAPFAMAFPLELHNTVTLTPEADQTRLTLRAVPIDPSEEERQAFLAMFASMRQGFGGTMDQLEAYLAKG